MSQRFYEPHHGTEEEHRKGVPRGGGNSIARLPRVGGTPIQEFFVPKQGTEEEHWPNPQDQKRQQRRRRRRRLARARKDVPVFSVVLPEEEEEEEEDVSEVTGISEIPSEVISTLSPPTSPELRDQDVICSNGITTHNQDTHPGNVRMKKIIKDLVPKWNKVEPEHRNEALQDFFLELIQQEIKRPDLRDSMRMKKLVKGFVHKWNEEEAEAGRGKKNKAHENKFLEFIDQEMKETCFFVRNTQNTQWETARDDMIRAEIHGEWLLQIHGSHDDQNVGNIGTNSRWIDHEEDSRPPPSRREMKNFLQRDSGRNNTYCNNNEHILEFFEPKQGTEKVHWPERPVSSVVHDHAEEEEDFSDVTGTSSAVHEDNSDVERL